MKCDTDLSNLEHVVKATVMETVKSSLDQMMKEIFLWTFSSSAVKEFPPPSMGAVCDPKNLNLRLDSTEVTDCELSGAETRSWAIAVSRRNRIKRMRKNSPGSRLSDEPQGDLTTDHSNSQCNNPICIPNYALALKALGIPNQQGNCPSNSLVSAPKRNPPKKLFGTSTSAANIKAARDLIKKKYFYVGNLDVACKAENLQYHLSSLGTETLKCELSKSKFKNTSSFHACIEEKHRKVFETVSNWPQHVVVREWVFKEKKDTVKPRVSNDAANNSESTILAEHDAHTDSSILLQSRHSSESSMIDNGDAPV